MWRNTPTAFGLTTRLLHWLMAGLIVALLVLGTVLVRIQPDLSTLWLYGLHKTLGLCALVLAFARLVWHRISPPPAPTGPPNQWANRAARAAHVALYLLMLAIPLSGWIASSATGLDVVIFGQITLPAIAPTSEALENAGFAAHSVLTKLLMALLLTHIAGATLRGLKHDGTLRRITKGS
ncbi:cytochrome b [Cypionkella aquatica]|uniref:Cytochrome b n=1 Tax=Cypionkella aquatica TaxID=1756042 RepID=A0AA37TV53_9RHOB|nr:cytochrome b [Cypionkella aquatica]GLS88297.1 cytochrome b [Cypionkella aquatica]